jgi:recombinational DNA repair protein RecT
MKLAYLVPRSVNQGGQWVVETHLEPSYMGLCKLVTDTGSAKRIYSHVVYEGDEFEVSLGISMDLKHAPKFKTKEITNVYCVAILSDGSPMIEVMTKEDVDSIRDRSESYKAFNAGKIKSCVWASDYSEMARKTVIRRAIKQIPKTDMWNRVGQAVQLDETDYKASEGQISYIESLLINVNIDHEEQGGIFRELPTMSASRAQELIEYLNENQLDPIQSGISYGQTEIKTKIANDITGDA